MDKVEHSPSRLFEYDAKCNLQRVLFCKFHFDCKFLLSQLEIDFTSVVFFFYFLACISVCI